MNKVQHIKSNSLLAKQRSYGTLEDVSKFAVRSNSKEAVSIMDEVNQHNDRYKRNRGPYQQKESQNSLKKIKEFSSIEGTSRFSNFKPKRHSSYNSYNPTNQTTKRAPVSLTPQLVQ